MVGQAVLEEGRIEFHDFGIGFTGDHVDLVFASLLFVVQLVQERAFRRLHQDLTLVLVESQNFVGFIQFVDAVDDSVRVNDYLMCVEAVYHQGGEEEHEETEEGEHEAGFGAEASALRVIDEKEFEETEFAGRTDAQKRVDGQLHEAVADQHQQNQRDIAVEELQVVGVLKFVRPDQMADLVGADRDDLAHLQFAGRIAELLRHRMKVQLIGAHQMRGANVLNCLLDALQSFIEEKGQPENAVPFDGQI